MLKKLEIQNKSRIYPIVLLNPKTGIFELKGRSLPEDADKFYNLIIDWLLKYVKNPSKETLFIFKLDYYNSASARKITDILLILSKINRKVSVKWYYEEDDDVMIENGQDFELITKIPFEFIEFK